jgi:hypothetical protein
MGRGQVYPAQSVFGTHVTLQRSPTLALLERPAVRPEAPWLATGPASSPSNATAHRIAAIGSRSLDRGQNRPYTIHRSTMRRAHLDPRCALPSGYDGPIRRGADISSISSPTVKQGPFPADAAPRADILGVRSGCPRLALVLFEPVGCIGILGYPNTGPLSGFFPIDGQSHVKRRRPEANARGTV